MNNADKPINPIIQDEHIGQGERILQCTQAGLTKREYFAGLAMQGYLASNNGQTSQYLAERSVKAADELLRALADELLKALEK